MNELKKIVNYSLVCSKNSNIHPSLTRHNTISFFWAIVPFFPRCMFDDGRFSDIPVLGYANTLFVLQSGSTSIQQIINPDVAVELFQGFMGNRSSHQMAMISDPFEN